MKLRQPPSETTIADCRRKQQQDRQSKAKGKYTRHEGYVQFKYAGFEIWGMKYTSKKDRRNKIEYFTQRFKNFAFEVHIRPHIKNYADLRFKKEILDNITIAA
jgi:hypothetical protein